MSEENKKYALKYKITPGEFTKEEIQKEDAGGCDQLVLISILKNPGPGMAKSFCTVAWDGIAKEELDPVSIFQAWAHLANQLKMLNLPRWQMKLCNHVDTYIADTIAEMRARG